MRVPSTVPARNKCWCIRRVKCVCLAVLLSHFDLLMSSLSRIHEYQHRKHEQCKNRGPLQQETEHDQDERNVLRMADTRVGTTHRQHMFFMRRIEHLPCRGEQPKTASDECHAKHMKRSPMRMGTPAEQHLQKMSRIVAQPVHPRISTLQPAR